MNIAEIIRLTGKPATTVRRHMKQGYCKWPEHVMQNQTKDPAYKCWENMVQRCTNPEFTGHEHYSDRGISLYPLWRDFRKFIADVGPRPSSKHSLDRINVDGNYEPGNVRWATQTEQNQNRRHKIQKHGKKFRFMEKGVIKVFNTLEEAQAACKWMLLAFLLSSCITPDQWSPSEHRQTMMKCMVMCRKEAKSYEPLTGECVCQVPHSSGQIVPMVLQ